MVWSRTDRKEGTHDGKLDNLWNINAMQVVMNWINMVKEEQGTGILNVEEGAESQLIHQWKHDQEFGKTSCFNVLKFEDISWLVFIFDMQYFVRGHNVISMLSTMLNIDSRNYVIVKVYHFHHVRPPDILFSFF